MNEINSALCQQIKQALQNSQEIDSPSILSLMIDQIPEIKNYINPGLRSYYDKALPITQKDVDRNISKFPLIYKLDIVSLNCQNLSDAALVRKYFVKWVVMILKRDCIDKSRGIKYKEISLDTPIANQTTIEDIIPDLTLTGIEKIYQQKRQSLTSKMMLYVEKDPEEKLKKCYPRQRSNTPERPHCNCQFLIKKRFFDEPPYTYKELAQELQVSIPTIQNRIEKHCLPLLKQIADKLIEKIRY